MITPNEYRAEILKISGFALMTPLGTLIISLGISEVNLFSFKTFIFLFFFGFLFYVGVIIVCRGLKILEGKDK